MQQNDTHRQQEPNVSLSHCQDTRKCLKPPAVAYT